MNHQSSVLALPRAVSISLALGLFIAASAAVSALADGLSGGSSHNMRLVGTNDLQGRSTYQPTLHKYPRNRYILFAGHHALANQGEGLLPGGTRLPSFNPLTGNNELNGTSIVDVSDPRHPKYLYHLPVSDGVNGGGQMVRVGDGSSVTSHDNKIYMMGPYANSGSDIHDV